MIALAILGSALFLGLPLAIVFTEALRTGVGAWASSIIEPETLHAVWLTVLTALVCVPVNIVFGVAVAWLISRFSFPGRKLLITLVEVPFSVSPVVAGVSYLFLYGAQGLLGPWLSAHNIQIMFAPPAIFLVSLFVTAPFVARELLSLMQTQSGNEEEAALSLGASGWQMFFHVTLPNMRWALFYGAVLCNARVMGEFGSVSVVSGAIRGQTNTLPLQIEQLFNDYNVVGAFSASTVLALIAMVTLVLKYVLEIRGAGASRGRH
ncbi:sulfate transport system permease protein [Faunimonas pinastri]|uniref:Sulfate transport system permease protein n=2 Tax=Faunimonas pinastri TaxID=1855383 RepID=A0A1H9KSH8_9HYPH|nr:sulfate transport system permease protein [Faunimonas pinastri]